MMNHTRYRIIDTHTGRFALIAHADGSMATSWLGAGVPGREWIEDRRLMPDLARRLVEYFKGKDVDFFDVELPRGGAFHRRCWRACREIPRGTTLSYAELAVAAGSSGAAARAAGQAMRRNPMPIITPCHRVVGSTGSLHGFSGSVDAAGGPLSIKRALLEMEGAAVRRTPSRTLGIGNRSHVRGRCPVAIIAS